MGPVTDPPYVEVRVCHAAGMPPDGIYRAQSSPVGETTDDVRSATGMNRRGTTAASHAQEPALPDGTHLYLSVGDPTKFLGHRGLGVSIMVRDGVVTGIGSARQFC